MGTGTCPICGSAFRARTGRPRLFCSRICRQRAHAMRHHRLLDTLGYDRGNTPSSFADLEDRSLLRMLEEAGVATRRWPL